MKGDKQKALADGCDGYITKPVDLEKFLELIKQLQRFWHADLILPAV